MKKNKIKLNSEFITTSRMTKQYELEINGKEVFLNKWWIDDEYEADSDYEFLDKSDKKLNKIELEEVKDYINDLK